MSSRLAGSKMGSAKAELQFSQIHTAGRELALETPHPALKARIDY